MQKTVCVFSASAELVAITGQGHGQLRLSGTGQRHLLYAGWRKSMPVYDHGWVLRRMFVQTPNGLEVRQPARLWYSPPAPLEVYSQPPESPDVFFSTKLCYWAPYELWKVRLSCPEPTCRGHQLTSSSQTYKHTVRQVLAYNGYYNMASEYLECTGCKKRYISWSDTVLSQLSLRHRAKFPAILTYRYACDMEVVGMMRERSLGNSCSQLYRKLVEQHRLTWLQRGIEYTSVYEPFAARQPGVVVPEIPPQPDVLLPRWLRSVYLRDVMSRIDDVKAKLTSTFGRVLKVESTKKLTRKLAGAAARTAQWVTVVGNEHGQVLTCVLTTAEGAGLDEMGRGLVRRYREAHVDPPKVLYVDSDCCGPAAGRIFRGWKDLQVRLDIWHLMRRFARGCTAESHQLYGVFMSRLSTCIFEWDAEDIAKLCRAKAALEECDEADARRMLSRRELALHCRRRMKYFLCFYRATHRLAVAIQMPLHSFMKTVSL